MAGRIRDEDVALVRERSPIAAVIGEHLQLRSAGAERFKGLCPFHDEKTPSFSVNAGAGFYHCFGCGESGDVLTFVRKIEQLTFPEAVERLASRAGVALTYEQGGAAPRQQQGLRQRLLDAHAAAAEFYREQLRSPEAQPARDYLTGRGFDPGVWEIYGIGYAPRGWEVLLRHLASRGFSRDELTTGGLAKASARGTLIDSFRGRLLWPIRDTTGSVIGFNARKLTDDDPGPKYLNSAESPIFRKSSVLYGLDLAKKEIAKRSQAVVVEGVSDVMACHLAGVPTAVATCGTAFGAEHIAVLRRMLLDQDEFRGEVVFTFDGDAAGQKAAVRAFDDDQRFVSQTFVAIDPDGLDPCELRQQRGDEAVRRLVSGRIPLVEFVVRSTLARYDLEIPEGRVAALAAAAPKVAAIKDRSLRPEYARRLAGWLGMDVDLVLSRVGEQIGPAPAGGTRGPTGLGSAAVLPARSRQASAEAPPRAPAPRSGPAPNPRDRTLLVEREVLKLALQYPQLLAGRFDEVPDEVFTASAYAVVRSTIAAAGGAVTGGTAGAAAGWRARVRDRAPDDEVRALITSLLVEAPQWTGEPDERYAAIVLARLLELAAGRRIEAIKGRLQRLDPVQTPDEYAAVFAELLTLESERRLQHELANG